MLCCARRAWGLFKWCSDHWTLERLSSKVANVIDEAPDRLEGFVDACRQNQSFIADKLFGNVLSFIGGSDEIRQKFLLEALDAGRAKDPNMPAYQMLRSMFKLNKPLGDSQYEVLPKSNNELRTELYNRAIESGPIANSCKRILASIEGGRRELGRPDGEPRHPILEEGTAWTDVLLTNDAAKEI